MAIREPVRTRPGRDRLTPRQALAVGIAGYAAAALLPVVLWHSSIAAVADDFRLDLDYLFTGWVGYGLILAGLGFFAPVVASIGRRPGDRFYPMARAAYAAWGLSLYLLGMALASQVALVTGQHPVG
jgi:hypothetical protein